MSGRDEKREMGDSVEVLRLDLDELFACTRVLIRELVARDVLSDSFDEPYSSFQDDDF